MADMGMDLGSLLAVMQRNKQLREDRRQFNESQALREAALEFERERAKAADEQWAKTFQQTGERIDIDRDRAETARGQLGVAQGTLAIAQDEHAWAKKDRQQKEAIENARSVYGNGIRLNFITNDGTVTQNFQENLLNDPNAEEFALDLINLRPDRFGGEDFKVTQIDVDKEPGYVVLRGENGDGSPGVVTENASTDDNDPVVRVPVQEFYANLSSVGVGALFGTAFQGDDAVEFAIQNDLNQDQVKRATELVTKEALVSEGYRQGGQVDGRNIENVMYNLPEGTEESHAFMRDLAAELGIATEQEVEPSATGSTSSVATTPYLQRLERMEAHANMGGGGPRSVDVVTAALEEARRTSTGGTAIAGGRDPKIVRLERELKEAEELYAPLNAVRAGQASEDPAAPQMEPRSFDQLNKDVRMAISSGQVSQEDIARLIDEGYLKPSPEDLARLKKTMDANGIKTADQLDKLPSEEAARGYAVLYALAKDGTERAAINKRFNNLLTTGNEGVSFSDMTHRQNSDLAVLNATKPSEDKYLAPAQQWLDGQREARREASDDIEWIIEAGLPALLPRIAEARSPGEYRALNYELGVYFDKLYTEAANADRGLAEKFTSMFGGTPATEDNLDWTNSRLGKGSDGKIYMFDEDGRKLGSEITKEKLRDLGVPVKLFHQFGKIADRNDQERNTIKVGG